MDNSISHLDKTWQFLPFIYQGAVRNRTGDNLEATLVLSTNPISMSYAQEVVEEKLQVVVQTALMDAYFNEVKKVINTEQWIGTSMSYDTEAVELSLASRIDAVGLSTPNQVLTRATVGALPTSGNIQAR
jgi:ribosome-associated toxin RatA of RatAB toxin-antitoxin module